MQISWLLLSCTILQAAYYVDILVITQLHNIVDAFYEVILVITLLHNIIGSIKCRYLGHYFAAQYCRQRTMQISWSLLLLHNIVGSWSMYTDILVFTLLHKTVGSVLCRYLGHNFAAQYCRQHTMQISWSLLCCTILLATYYVDILVITLLHNIVGSVLCRYLSHYLLYNTVCSVLYRYLGRYFAAQYCRQRNMQICWSLLCCTILLAWYYVHILVVTLLNKIVGSVL